MGYSAENYRLVKELLEKRRKDAIAQSERRRADLHAQSPEMAEIDRALRGTGMALFRAACEGGKESPAFKSIMEQNKTLLKARKDLLKALGLPPDYTEVHYTCPACGDSGYVDIHMCTCMRRELTLAGFASSGLGSLLSRQSFENFSLDYYGDDPATRRRMEKNLKIAREYAENFSLSSGNLIFFGQTGLGKTHISTAIARLVIERGFDVRYESAPNIFEDFENDRFNRIGREEARSEKYFAAELLIVDDLGAEAINQYTVSCLYNLINTRASAGRPTIISTNLEHGELQGRYNDRITSRLLGEYQPLMFVGSDIRMQKLQ